MNVKLSKADIERLRASSVVRRRLAIRALLWVGAIERLCEAVGRAGEEHPAPYDTDIHMLVLALEHLDSCVRLLQQGGEEAQEWSTFLDLWAKVSDVRDALEHEEEYLIEAGRKHEFRGPLWNPKGMPSAVTIWGTNGPDSISVLGKQYEIGRATASALRLKSGLKDLAKRLDADVGAIVESDHIRDEDC